MTEVRFRPGTEDGDTENEMGLNVKKQASHVLPAGRRVQAGAVSAAAPARLLAGRVSRLLAAA